MPGWSQQNSHFFTHNAVYLVVKSGIGTWTCYATVDNDNGNAYTLYVIQTYTYVVYVHKMTRAYAKYMYTYVDPISELSISTPLYLQ